MMYCAIMFLHVLAFVLPCTGGVQHLRSGIVRRPTGMHSLPVPISKMYKSVKWWTEVPGDGKMLVPAQKQELGSYFKEQLQQVWDVSKISV